MKTEIVAAGRLIGPEQFARISERNLPTFECHGRVLVFARSRAAYAASLLLCRELDQQLVIAPSAMAADAIEPRLSELGITLVVRDLEGDSLVVEECGEPAKEKAVGGVLIFTSGSTGAPKLAQHSWRTISASSRFVPERLVGATWFMAYEPGSYAGLQVFFSALSSDGRLVIPEAGERNRHPEQIVEHGVNAISATPTWWRMLMSSWPPELERPRLVQATLGGEPVSQRVIDSVKEFFAPEHLTHIYASTEAGTAIVVSDGLEGFPASLLSEKAPIGLRLQDGLLEVRSPGAMQGYLGRDSAADGGWIRTADRIEIRGDRCYLIGREDGVINVGGMKVSPEEVEAAINELPGIKDCAVYARRNPVVGSVLAADLVVDRDGTATTVAEIRQRLASKLASFKMPQYIRFVSELTVAESGKKLRN